MNNPNGRTTPMTDPHTEALTEALAAIAGQLAEVNRRLWDIAAALKPDNIPPNSAEGSKPRESESRDQRRRVMLNVLTKLDAAGGQLKGWELARTFNSRDRLVLPETLNLLAEQKLIKQLDNSAGWRLPPPAHPLRKAVKP